MFCVEVRNRVYVSHLRCQKFFCTDFTDFVDILFRVPQVTFLADVPFSRISKAS